MSKTIFQKKFFLFPVEVKSRELDSKLILGLHLLILSKNKLTIIIGKNTEVHDYLKKIKNKSFIYFANGLDNDEIIYRDINQKGGKYVFHDEEGAIMSRKTKNLGKILCIQALKS